MSSSMQTQPKAEFKKVTSVPFCEDDFKRYTMEVTTINGKPYLNMASYFLGRDNEWKQDRKKNYFMSAKVVELLFVKWGNVSRRICDQLSACVIDLWLFTLTFFLYKFEFDMF